MKSRLGFLFLIFAISLFGQKNPTKRAQPIVKEGKMLYQSEMASWYGTDIFLANFKDHAQIGGYFSYPEDTITKCIFYSKKEPVTTLGEITFDSTFSVETAQLDLKERELTIHEKNLYSIRILSQKLIQKDRI